MGNCPQVNNTCIKGTSAVTYDSTPLPCTDVNTCDGLNTILDKFDTIICDVKESVDILTEQVIDITEDLMIITEDIINIQNQLEICCPTCDFTGTADQLLDCNFTGTASQFLDCSFTGTANELPDTTTTTTSSSSSSTTTTTTTVDPYFYYVANQYTCPNCSTIVGTNVIIKSISPLSIGNWVIHTFDSINYFSFNVLSVSVPNYMATLVNASGSSPSCNCPITTTTTTTNTTAPPTYAGEITNNTGNTITANTAFIRVNGGMVAAATLNIPPGGTQTFSTSYTPASSVIGAGNDFTLELYTYTGVTVSNDMNQVGGTCVTTTGDFVDMGTYLSATSTTTGPVSCAVYTIAMTIT